MRLLFIITIVVFISCKSEKHKKNDLEKELDSITEGTTKEELSKIDFQNSIINWDNPTKWESDCEYYDVIPEKDTFQHKYYLDFCYDKFRWWTKNEKREEDVNTLQIGYEFIPIDKIKNQFIYLDFYELIDYKVPNFNDTIISFDSKYYYEKYELKNPINKIQEEVGVLENITVKQLKNNSKSIQLLTEDGIFEVSSFSLKIMRNDTSYEKVFNLDHALVDSLGKSELYKYGFNWIFENIKQNDELLITELEFEYNKKAMKVNEKILIKIK